MFFQAVHQKQTLYSTTVMLEHFYQAHFNLRAWVTSCPQLRTITQQEMTANTNISGNVIVGSNPL